MASTSCSFRRACPSASRTTGTICRKCSREASSGTTPPYLRCTSSCDATILDRISRPSTTTAAAVSSQEDSRSEEHTSELQSRLHLVCRLLLEKKKTKH